MGARRKPSGVFGRLKKGNEKREFKSFVCFVVKIRKTFPYHIFHHFFFSILSSSYINNLSQILIPMVLHQHFSFKFLSLPIIIKITSKSLIFQIRSQIVFSKILFFIFHFSLTKITYIIYTVGKQMIEGQP